MITWLISFEDNSSFISQIAQANEAVIAYHFPADGEG